MHAAALLLTLGLLGQNLPPTEPPRAEPPRSEPTRPIPPSTLPSNLPSTQPLPRVPPMAVPFGPAPVAPPGFGPGNTLTPTAPITSPDLEPQPPIAQSGRVQLQGITIHRAKVVGIARREQTPQLKLDLVLLPPPQAAGDPQPPPPGLFPPEVNAVLPRLLPAPAGFPGNPAGLPPPGGTTSMRVTPIVYRIASLEPIQDNTGHLLASKERLDAMPFLREDSETGLSVRGDQVSFAFILTLDAPARPATHVKLLKGKLVVSKLKIAALGFKDLAALDGKPLDHPKLKGREIRVKVEESGDRTTVYLQTPAHYRQLLHWGLAKDERMLEELPVPVAPQPLPPSELSPPSPNENGVFQMVRSYSTQDAKGAILGIAWSDAVEWQTFPFEFKDIELP